MKKLLLVAFALLLSLGASSPAKESSGEEFKFTDVVAQTEEFIGYYHSIQLTPEQEQIKKDALSSFPAPCCQEFTMATCCCPCNFAKSVWGLSNYLIAKKNYKTEQVKQTALRWIDFGRKGTKPAGDACFTGRCSKPFHQDGCGGMKEDNVIY